MTWRTPPSLKWLIDKHSRLQGVLQILERQSTESDRQAAEHRKLVADAQRNLLAIECALGMHEIKVDPLDIQGIRPHLNKPMYRHGDLTKQIITALKSSGGWMSTGDVVEHVTGYTYETSDHELYERVRRSFRKRMRVMAANGRIDRQPSSGYRGHALWRLPRSLG